MRLDQVTFTRFLAAIAIVVFHYGTDITPFHLAPTAFLFQKGNIGVSYFFILSGFIMMISYAGKNRINPLDYYRKRFARIYPLYLLAILLFIAYLLFTHGIIDYTALMLNLLLVQSWLPKYALSFNSPGWSLAVETLFYALFPLLFNKLYSKVSLQRIWLPIVIFWILTQILFIIGLHSPLYDSHHPMSHQFLVYFPLLHLNQFLMGNLAGLFFLQSKDRLSKNHDIAILFLVFTCCLLLKYPIGRSFTGAEYHDGLMAVVFVPFIMLMSANTGIITRVFKAKPLTFLGEISYGIYILQRPVFLWSRELFVRLGIYNYTMKFYCFLALLLVCSVVSYYLVEVPLRKIIVGTRARRKLTYA